MHKAMKVGVFVWMPLLILTCDEPGNCQDKKAEKPANFEIHEWGVFTAPRNSYWLKQDMVAEWSSFPDFFHGVWPKKKLAYYGPVTKPVIYFHSKDKLNIQLQIEFTTGRPLIWWPPAVLPCTGRYGRRKSLVDGKDLNSENALLFHLRMNQGMENRPQVDSKHWMSQLRKVRSAPLSAHGGYSRLGDHRHGENFVYYDGVMKSPKPPTVVRKKRGIQFKSHSDHDWLDVFVIDRTNDELRVADKVIDRIAAGKRVTSVSLEKVEDTKQASKSLLKKLIKAGLNEDEAQALLAVWGEGLFERGGLTIFYRVPQKTYDQWLPIATKPIAKKTVRVGLVAHFRMEPELDEVVKKLVAQLDSNRYQVRANADKQLREIGGPAFPAIKEASKSASTEVRMRCEKILGVQKLEKQLQELMKSYEKKNSDR